MSWLLLRMVILMHGLNIKFWGGFCSGWVLLQLEGFLRKPLSCLRSQTDCQAPHVSSLSITWSAQRQPLQIYKTQVQFLWVDVRSLVWFISYFTSINSHVSPHPYHLSPVMFRQFTRDWWQSQTNLEFIWRLTWILMAVWLSERIQMFLNV
jgi:hypothetical protein